MVPLFLCVLGATFFRVDTVEISGNTRTASDVIARELGFAPGDRIGPAQLHAAEIQIMNLRLFSQVEVDHHTEGGRHQVDVRVKERWTLIPIPLVFATGDGFRVGGFLFESNLFGRNKNLLLGGFYSPQGSSLFTLYQDPGVYGSSWLVESQLLAFSGPRERFEGDSPRERFNDRFLDLRLLGGFACAHSSITQSLNLYLGGFGTWGETRGGPARGGVLGPALGVRHNGQNFAVFVSEGFRFDVFVGHADDRWGANRSTSRADLFANYGTLLPWKHSVSLTAQGRYRSGDDQLDLEVLGGRPGTRGFRLNGLWSQRALFGTIEYAVPIGEYRGTWALAGFADAGALRWREQQTHYINPGWGVRYFLKNVALPALGIDVVYNARDGIWRGGFSLGSSR